MFKSPFHRITALLMAFLMLVSATGFSMDLHYCQNQLQGFSLIGKAKSCHEKRATVSCHTEKAGCQHLQNKVDPAEEDDCCHNKKVIVKSNDTLATSPQAFVQNDQFAAYITSFHNLLSFNDQVEKEIQSYLNFKPPIPNKDIQLLYQVFLI